MRQRLNSPGIWDQKQMVTELGSRSTLVQEWYMDILCYYFILDSFNHYALSNSCPTFFSILFVVALQFFFLSFWKGPQMCCLALLPHFTLLQTVLQTIIVAVLKLMLQRLCRKWDKDLIPLACEARSRWETVIKLGTFQVRVWQMDIQKTGIPHHVHL